MMVIVAENMIGKTFIITSLENEEKYRARIVRGIKEREDKISKNRKENPEIFKHSCSFNNDQYEEMVAYTAMLIHIKKDTQDDNI